MVGDKKDKEDRGFTVKDRRMKLDGETDQASQEEEKSIEEPVILTGGENKEKSREKSEQPLPPLDFAQFVMSLATSAMIHLGDMAHPADNQRHIELSAAQETIDILALLEEKTRGNLSREEESLLTQVIADLRIRFVQKKSKK